jgi:Icc-related predicted phosphoesterase
MESVDNERKRPDPHQNEGSPVEQGPLPVRIAASGDLHYGRSSHGSLHHVFGRLPELGAQVLVLCGDLTDYGLPEEARALAQELTSVVKIPIVAVLGNHDFESSAADEVQQILSDAQIRILDGDTCEVAGVGFAGTKGFAGGFGRAALRPWGEPGIKQFVHESIAEALKLETALARLKTSRRVAVLHYAPVQCTVEGEPPDIYAFLGCSRLEEPLLRYPVTAVFHAHAHNGSLEGHTVSGTPVYNVSLPLMQRLAIDPPMRLYDLAADV